MLNIMLVFYKMITNVDIIYTTYSNSRSSVLKHFINFIKYFKNEYFYSARMD